MNYQEYKILKLFLKYDKLNAREVSKILKDPERESYYLDCLNSLLHKEYLIANIAVYDLPESKDDDVVKITLTTEFSKINNLSKHVRSYHIKRIGEIILIISAIATIITSLKSCTQPFSNLINQTNIDSNTMNDSNNLIK